MSKTIYKSNRMFFTEYWNGEEKAVQINTSYESVRGYLCYISVTKDTAIELIEQLSNWVKSQ